MGGLGALELYQPIDVPKPFGENLWIVDGPQIGMSYLGFSLPFTTRATLIRLPEGVWVHSPIRLTDDLAARVEALGPVRWIVAPNSLHHVYAADWKERFPEAELWAVQGLADEQGLRVDQVIGVAAPPAWAGAIDQLTICGDAINEAVFFHRSSRTLILTDLIENFEQDKVRSRVLRTLVRFAGIADPDGSMPRDMRLTFLRHRKALRSAVRQMIGWKPERVVIAHGRPYETGGAAELKRAFRWLLR